MQPCPPATRHGLLWWSNLLACIAVFQRAMLHHGRAIPSHCWQGGSRRRYGHCAGLPVSFYHINQQISSRSATLSYPLPGLQEPNSRARLIFGGRDRVSIWSLPAVSTLTHFCCACRHPLYLSRTKDKEAYSIAFRLLIQDVSQLLMVFGVKYREKDNVFVNLHRLVLEVHGTLKVNCQRLGKLKRRIWQLG